MQLRPVWYGICMDKEITSNERSAEIHQLVTDWWQESGYPLLPGEGDGVTLFEVRFQDGCRYFGLTEIGVFERLVELSRGLVDIRSSLFVSGHCRHMCYVVRCLASGLDRGVATNLREEVVAEAPDGYSPVDGATVVSAGCWLNGGSDPTVVMSFAEWAKSVGEVVK